MFVVMSGMHMEILLIVAVCLFILFLPMIIGLMVMGGQKPVVLIHSQSGMTSKGYIGYCWTYYIFGCLVPLFRGEIGIALMHLVFTIISFGLFQIVMPFLYNRQYMTRQLTNGWELYDTAEMNDWARMKLGIAMVN